MQVLGANYCIMPKARDLWIRTDRFSFGGPRPVYTLRYVERSICILASYCNSRGEGLGFKLCHESLSWSLGLGLRDVEGLGFRDWGLGFRV